MASFNSGAAKKTALKSEKSKRNLIDDSDSNSDSDEGGAQLDNSGFKVNEEYARRFEYNKKREERQKLEEKYNADGKGQNAGGWNRDDDDDDGDDKDSSSSNETEDEDGFLATEDLDAQISATLQAIRNKDPRLYDKDYKFIELPDEEEAGKPNKEKPVFLKDYQREKLLRGDIGGSDAEDKGAPQTYNQAQDALKKSIVSEIKAAKGEDTSDDSDSDDGFMKKKKNSAVAATATATKTENGVHPSRAATIKVSELDVKNADKDPETYLSNFLASRAWIPEEGGRWKAFESDDGEDNVNNADKFEQAYNLRFEDPEKSNEVLKSYARDFAAARSVRRDEKSGRQRQRDLERERKEEQKQQRREEKARLRKLKLEETEEKLRKVKQAAGAAGKELTEAEWMAFLDEAWDNDKWEEEMMKRFGDEYYAVEEDGVANADSDDSDGEQDATEKKKKRKHPKKPKWDDDIDIKDLIPDFEESSENAVPGISLTGDAGDEDQDEEHEEEQSRPSKKRKSADHKREKLETQKKARQQRSKLEALVDSKLELTHHELLNPSFSSSTPAATLSSNKDVMPFRYRESSPQSFGMTARDILLAPSDKDLNDYFGLKKLASFRDPEKKRRDKKRLGKKARLREWRRGTFGREFEKDGPTYGFEKFMEEGEEDTLMKDAPEGREDEQQDGERMKKKRKRSKGGKGTSAGAE
ncbi:hypothetical protein E4U58_001827 [Claviceps cyperi]|nr:hypothetical protein E4U58_001827 [Claviceps cyperi]